MYLKAYRNFAQAQQNIARFLEAVYNHKRLHSALEYLPPAEFETKCREAEETAEEIAEDISTNVPNRLS